MTLSEALNEFLIDQAARGNSDKTYMNYRQMVGRFIEYNGDVETGTLTVADVKNYYLYLINIARVSRISAQSYIRQLRAFLRWCYDSGYMNENIPYQYRLPKATKKQIDVLSDSEIALIFEFFTGNGFCTVRNRAIIQLFLDSGLRLSELVGVKRRMLHIDERYVVVNGKGDKQRAAPFGTRTQMTLRQYAAMLPSKSEPCFFQKEDGGAITEEVVKNIFRDLRQYTGIPRLHPHLLRHTFATRYLENGGNVYALQSILGHTSLEMVKRYTHLATAKIRRDFVNFSPIDRFYSEETEGDGKAPENVPENGVTP